MVDSTWLRPDVLVAVFSFGTAALGVAATFLKERWRMGQHKPYVRTEEPEFVTAGEMGRMVGITAAQASALYERGFLLPVGRVGRQRAIPATDREKVRAAAIKAGYLKE